MALLRSRSLLPLRVRVAVVLVLLAELLLLLLLLLLHLLVLYLLQHLLLMLRKHLGCLLLGLLSLRGPIWNRTTRILTGHSTAAAWPTSTAAEASTTIPTAWSTLGP